jgi:hypothetical protein
VDFGNMIKLTDILNQILQEEKKKADRCKRIADRKFDKPSAYKSGAIVRCRKGNIWKDLKEETNVNQTAIVDSNGDPMIVYRSQEDDRKQGIDRASKLKGIYFSANKESTKIYGSNTKSYYLNIKNPLVLKDTKWNLSVLDEWVYNSLIDKGYDGAVWLRNGEMYEIIAFYPEQVIPINDKVLKRLLNNKDKPYKEAYSSSDDNINEAESLHKWFKRSGPRGKEKGWIDCNAPDGKGGYKACGRKEGEKRSKYPACRPTPAGCKKKGKGKTWGKTK